MYRIFHSKANILRMSLFFIFSLFVNSPRLSPKFVVVCCDLRDTHEMFKKKKNAVYATVINFCGFLFAESLTQTTEETVNSCTRYG